MAEEGYCLRLIEWSQADSLLAFAVSVVGQEAGFPVLLGVSVRSRQSGTIDLLPHAVERSGHIVCLVEHPERLGEAEHATMFHFSGDITFALWSDNSCTSELARIPWQRWKYYHVGILDPNARVDPCTVAYFENEFTVMRERYKGAPFWNASKLTDTRPAARQN